MHQKYKTIQSIAFVGSFHMALLLKSNPLFPQDLSFFTTAAVRCVPHVPQFGYILWERYWDLEVHFPSNDFLLFVKKNKICCFGPLSYRDPIL